VLTYVLITLCLSLTGIAGFQMAYMFYLDKIDRERKKRIRDLETKCRTLETRLEAAQQRIAEQEKRIKEITDSATDDQDVWVDVLEDF
jgi:uncharacterized protein YlxW (UPF0749 family)